MQNSKSFIVAAIIAVATFFYVFTGEDHLSLFDDQMTVDHQENDVFVEKKDDNDEMYYVTHIVDGDTFDIEGDERVRLIGIDTPERGEKYYRESTEYLRSLVDGKRVRLKKDVSKRDRYGRLLRHVYVDDVWINKKMIEDGYARLLTYPPDVSHVEVFSLFEQKAREKKIGLWGIDNE